MNASQLHDAIDFRARAGDAPAAIPSSGAGLAGNARQPGSEDAGGRFGPSGHSDFGLDTPVRTGIAGTMAIGTTGNFTDQDVNGLLSGTAWDTNHLTFSFPTAASNYGAGYGPDNEPNTFSVLDATQQDIVRYALSLVSDYTGLTFTEIAETDSVHANIRVAGSDAPATSWAYYPWESGSAGDIWIGNVRNDPSLKAGYGFDTFLHEIGHTLGLKHGHENDGNHGVLPTDHDSSEWSVMTYHSYVGGDQYYRLAEGSGYQTYMMDDIAALQYLYGANYSAHAANTTYSWNRVTGEMFVDGVGQEPSSDNKIYETVWDGGGTDTYDLHGYASRLVIDLRPGEWSTFDAGQLADLDSSNPGAHMARGNVANAHLFEDDPRSLIENAIGGRGRDTITGNLARNSLSGGAGNDRLVGLEDRDSLSGGGGRDNLDGGVGNDRLDGGGAADIVKGGAGNDLILGGVGADRLWGAAGADTFAFAALAEVDRDRIYDLDDAHDVIDLSAIDANSHRTGNQAFRLVSALDGRAGEAALVKHGAVTQLHLDADGDGVADAIMSMDGAHTGFTGFVL
jgi:serralysin